MVKVAGEGGHIVCGVGQVQHLAPDDLAGGERAERAVVGGGRDDGGLFHDVARDVVLLHLLPREIIVWERVEHCDQKAAIRWVSSSTNGRV